MSIRFLSIIVTVTFLLAHGAANLFGLYNSTPSIDMVIHGLAGMMISLWWITFFTRNKKMAVQTPISYFSIVTAALVGNFLWEIWEYWISLHYLHLLSYYAGTGDVLVDMVCGSVGGMITALWFKSRLSPKV